MLQILLKQLINIYINRDLSDYQKNNLKDPIDLFYSLEDSIPLNTIHGTIIDIKTRPITNKLIFNKLKINILLFKTKNVKAII